MIIDVEKIAKNAKNAYLKTMSLDDETKNKALLNISQKIINCKDEIFKMNEADLIEAKNTNLPSSLLDRLKLDDNKIRDLVEGLKNLSQLPNPVNQVIWEKELDDNLILTKESVPIGVIGVIFEARPDCFIQIAGLIIKSGNCAILKGGSEAKNTNACFERIVNEALKETKDFPENVINLVYSREDIKQILDLDEYINLIIPRGSNRLVKYIKENTKIPVLGHAAGICHIFVDESADLENSANIIIDAKTQYPSACNSVETLLIHKKYPHLTDLRIRLKDADIEIIENPSDYTVEYGEKILSLKTVDNIDEAINHINKYGSGHTDSILSKDQKNIEKFMNLVDSSSVFSNCSTRFSDGFRYGFGAEVGISTNKTHARGPVGLDGLTIYKYKLKGSNDIVRDYVSGNKQFKHKIKV